MVPFTTAATSITGILFTGYLISIVVRPVRHDTGLQMGDYIRSNHWQWSAYRGTMIINVAILWASPLFSEPLTWASFREACILTLSVFMLCWFVDWRYLEFLTYPLASWSAGIDEAGLRIQGLLDRLPGQRQPQVAPEVHTPDLPTRQIDGFCQGFTLSHQRCRNPTKAAFCHISAHKESYIERYGLVELQQLEREL